MSNSPTPLNQSGSPKRKKYVLKDNEELIDYVYENGKKYKKILWRERKLKGLTLEECAEIQKVFFSFDKDGSGSIDTNELRDAMRALGIFVKN